MGVPYSSTYVRILTELRRPFITAAGVSARSRFGPSLRIVLLCPPHLSFIPQHGRCCRNSEKLSASEHLASQGRQRHTWFHSAASMTLTLPCESISIAWPSYGDGAAVIPRRQGPIAQVMLAPESVTGHRLGRCWHRRRSSFAVLHRGHSERGSPCQRPRWRDRQNPWWHFGLVG